MNPILIGLLVVLGMNLLIFPIAYKLQTDKLTDITYSLSFATIAVFGFVFGIGTESIPKIILAILILLWAFRLGAFLLNRVTQMGRDERFDKIRTNPARFFRFFMIQAVSAWVIALPFLYRLIEHPGKSEGWGDVSSIECIGWGTATVGLIIEAVADQQKAKFKNQPNNADKLYTGGLYNAIRFPNYLGEILFWIGVFLASTPAIYSLRWLTITSPIIIILLLLFLTGIPTIERSRRKKLGDDPEYLEYLKRTKRLVPWVW